MKDEKDLFKKMLKMLEVLCQISLTCRLPSIFDKQMRDFEYTWLDWAKAFGRPKERARSAEGHSTASKKDGTKQERKRHRQWLT